MHPTKTTLWIMLALLIGCSTQPTQTADMPDSAEYMALGHQHWQEGNPELAIQQFETAQSLAPSLEIERAIGLASIDAHRFTKARRHLTALKDPEDLEVQQGLAIALLKTGEYAEAKQRFLHVFAKDPRRVKTLNYLGVLADLAGDHQNAEQYYLSALSLAPDHPGVLNNYGYSLLQRQAYQEAEQRLQSALALSTDIGRINNNLAILYARQCRYQRALDQSLNTLKQTEALNNVGYIALLNRDYDVAIRLFQQSLEESPSYNAKASDNLARAVKAKKSAPPGTTNFCPA